MSLCSFFMYYEWKLRGKRKGKKRKIKDKGVEVEVEGHIDLGPVYLDIRNVEELSLDVEQNNKKKQCFLFCFFKFLSMLLCDHRPMIRKAYHRKSSPPDSIRETMKMEAEVKNNNKSHGEASCSWVPHERTGIYYPKGQEKVIEDVHRGAAKDIGINWFYHNE